MRKKKNPANFDLVIGDRQIAAWLSKQHRRAAVVEGALAFCIAAGPASDAYASMFLPPEARALAPKTGATATATAKRPAALATPALASAAPPASPPRSNSVLGDYAK